MAGSTGENYMLKEKLQVKVSREEKESSIWCCFIRIISLQGCHVAVGGAVQRYV